MYKTIQSIVDNYTNDCIVLIADQGYASEEKDIKIEYFKSQIPLVYYRLPFFSGISAGRNFFVNLAKEMDVPFWARRSIQFVNQYNFDSAINFLNLMSIMVL